MVPQKPYLVRAFYEWIIESRCTPYIVVDVMVPGTEVPQEYVEDGEIVLDISPTAVMGLNIGNHKIVFQAMFRGIQKSIVVPIPAIMEIYANENGRGKDFTLEEDGGDNDPFSPDGGNDSPKDSGGKKKPFLRLVE